MKSLTGKSETIPPCPYCGGVSHTEKCAEIYNKTHSMTKTTLQERFSEKFYKESAFTTKANEDFEALLSFIEQEKQLSVREERERIMEILHKRKGEYHKECLNDMFINGRFWEAQDMWELLQKESKGISLITQTK